MNEPTAITISNQDATTTVIHQFTASQEANSVFIIFPAMGVKASYYQPLAEELSAAGSVAITADLRGNGFSSIRPSKKVDFSYKDTLNQDFTSILNYAET
ncbi:hypothetical protein ACFLR1_05710, partial [Bacteroidota bacterium]